MGQDPDQPGYAARHDPGDSRQVGSGKEFGADLYALYRAGRVHFPEKAILYSQLTTAVHDFEQRVEFLRSSVGGEYAVVQISTDYAATDLDATPYEPPSLEAPEAPGWWLTEWMEDQAGGLLDEIEEGIDVGVDTVQNWWGNR